MKEKIVVQMKDRIFSGKDTMSVMYFLQEFKSTCDACEIHEGTARWLSERFRTGPTEAEVKARAALTSFANAHNEAASKS